MGGGIPFGHYLLNRRIARGGMAEVFLATQHGPEGFERQVAIKRILPHLADSREFVEMFMDEARLAARLTHPNIAHIYEFGQVDDAYFIAMEYIDGVDLAPIFLAGERDLMPLAHVTRIAADVAAGLHYAHQQRSPDGRPLGIVHRDISPQNILVSFDGAVKIVDFGIAKATHHMDRTNPGEIRGKFSYMSPEQTRGEHLDGRSDVFCLGIVLYELVTGHALFSRTDPIGAMEEIRGGVLPTPTRQGIPLPSQLLQILQHALERDPDARYADAAAMQLDLETFLHSLQEISNSLTLAKYFREHYGAPRAEPSSGSPAPERAPGTMRAPEKPETVAAPDSDITARSPGNVTMLDTPAPREPPPGKPASPEPKTQILLRHNSNALDTSDESNTQIESSHRQVHGYLPASNGLPRADPNDATTLLRSPPPKHARDVPSSIPSRDQAPNAEAITGGPEKNTPTERIATARRRVAALIALITLILSASVLGYFLATPTFDAHPSSTGSGATHSTAATAPTTLQSLPGHITNAPADGAIDERTHAPDGETSDRDGDTPGHDTNRTDSSAKGSLSATALLRVTTLPRGARLRVDDNIIGKRTPLLWRGAPGQHDIKVTRQGYQTWHRSVQLPGTHTTRLHIKLRRKPHRATSHAPRSKDKRPGFLSVSTVPWARVYWGRRLLGMSPFANVSLPPGKHRLRFMNPQRRTLTRTVLIRPGRVTKLRFSLR